MRAPSYTLVPRSKGFIAALRGLEAQVDAVYDVTLAYPGGTPSLWQWVTGAGRHALVHVLRTPIETLPASDDDRRAWLLQRFAEKDSRIGVFVDTGELHETAKTTRKTAAQPTGNQD